MKKVREKKKKLGALKGKLWQLTKLLATKKFPQSGYRCYTCDARITGQNRQLGHFIPSSVCGAHLRYDLRNLRYQCMRCNMFAGGNGAEYYRRMVKEVGQEEVDKLFQEQNIIIKADSFWYEEKIAQVLASLGE